MDNRTKTALTSGAFTPQRSQYAGSANDDTLIFKAHAAAVVSLDEDNGIETMVFVKLPQEATTIMENGTMMDAFEIHLPPQIKKIDTYCFAGWPNIIKINMENVELVGEGACSNWGAVGSEDGVEIHLDSVKEVEPEAFVDANAVVYLNDKVETVGANAFMGIKHLYYHGDLEGAPWGANEWN